VRGFRLWGGNPEFVGWWRETDGRCVPYFSTGMAQNGNTMVITVLYLCMYCTVQFIQNGPVALKYHTKVRKVCTVQFYLHRYLPR
jgi:hypothetical protein